MGEGWDHSFVFLWTRLGFTYVAFMFSLVFAVLADPASRNQSGGTNPHLHPHTSLGNISAYCFGFYDSNDCWVCYVSVCSLFATMCSLVFSSWSSFPLYELWFSSVLIHYGLSAVVSCSFIMCFLAFLRCSVGALWFYYAVLGVLQFVYSGSLMFLGLYWLSSSSPQTYQVLVVFLSLSLSSEVLIGMKV